MRRVATIMALTAGLFGISHFALAGETIPSAGPVPSPGPTNSGDGGLLLYAWDPTTSVSLTLWLGRTMSNSQPADLAPAGGLALDYGVVPQFSTVFQLSDPANIHYGVVAGDNQPNSGQGQLGKNIAITGAPDGSSVMTTVMSQQNLSNLQNLIEGFMNNATQCSPLNGNPCVSGDFDGGGGPLPTVNGTAYLVSVLGATSPMLAANAGTVGNALGFYLFSTLSAPIGNATKQVYANVTGLGEWLLGTDGHLTYTIPGAGTVPLPAAVWLLMSGLAGFATVGRRRNAA